MAIRLNPSCSISHCAALAVGSDCLWLPTVSTEPTDAPDSALSPATAALARGAPPNALRSVPHPAHLTAPCANSHSALHCCQVGVRTCADAMVGVKHKGLAAVFAEADQTGDLEAAWTSLGRPTTLGNARRQYVAHTVAKKAAKAAAKKKKKVGKKAVRTKPSAKKPLRKPSRFVEEKAADTVRHLQEWRMAHSEMTLAASKIKAKGKARTKAFEMLAEAAEAKLSPNNPAELTAGSIKSWFKKGHKPGQLPKPKGRKKGEFRAAIVEAGKSLTRVYQIEGRGKRSGEIVDKLAASIKGTPQEKLLATTRQRQRMRADLRKGEDTVQSVQGESVEARRLDACTLENGVAWGAGWKEFLLKRNFGKTAWRSRSTGEIRLEKPRAQRWTRRGAAQGAAPAAPAAPAVPAVPAGGKRKRGAEQEPVAPGGGGGSSSADAGADDWEEGVYVSKAKRARIANLDEHHQQLTTKMEKGGPRARLLVDKRLGAATRTEYTVQTHISGMYGSVANGEALPPYFMIADATAEKAGAAKEADAAKAAVKTGRGRGKAGHLEARADADEPTARSKAEEKVLSKAVVKACIGLAKRCTFTASYGRRNGEVVVMKPGLETSKKGGT
eukprot:5003711-Prymnesium_polylepis.1